MRHWKCHLLATTVFLVGGVFVLASLGWLYITFFNPAFETASDIGNPKWQRDVFVFVFMFCALFSSSFLLPKGARQSSVLISGLTFVLLCFCGFALFMRPANPMRLVGPILRDMVPIVGAVFAAWLLQSEKVHKQAGATHVADRTGVVLGRSTNIMKWVLVAICCLLCFTTGATLIQHWMKPRFPWHKLVLNEASISSSLKFNPFSDIPPRHRWEVGMSFKEFSLRPENRSYAPIITYTVDLDRRGWRELPGSYSLRIGRGSDLWHGDDNFGPVYLDRIDIHRKENVHHEVTIFLKFEFAGSGYRPETKRFTFSADYTGLRFFVPEWGHPEKATFPPSWDVPTSNPHWNEADVAAFVGKYVDLSQYGQLEIDDSRSSTSVKAKPK